MEDVSYSQALDSGITGSLFGIGGEIAGYGLEALKRTRVITNMRNSVNGKISYYANIMKGKFDDVVGKASKVVELDANGQLIINGKSMYFREMDLQFFAADGTGTISDFVVSKNGVVEAIGNGQHVLQKHVGVSDNQLLSRLTNNPYISGASTFTDDITANHVINVALNDSQNISKINRWLTNGGKGNLPISYNGNSVIGRGVSRGLNVASDMTNARIILKSNGKGFDILTAYPTK